MILIQMGQMGFPNPVMIVIYMTRWASLPRDDLDPDGPDGVPIPSDDRNIYDQVGFSTQRWSWSRWARRGSHTQWWSYSHIGQVGFPYSVMILTIRARQASLPSNDPNPYGPGTCRVPIPGDDPTPYGPGRVTIPTDDPKVYGPDSIPSGDPMAMWVRWGSPTQ